jgi:hypothetical protein
MMVKSIKPESDYSIDDLRRRIRLILLLDAAESAGLTPLPIIHLHTFAYMSNVLSPVWDVPVIEGKVLKRRGSPFYASLQHDLDRLVGMGVVLVSSISHVLDGDQQWRLEGSYCLHRTFADRILQRIKAFEDECKLINFIQELAYALSALSDEDIGRATTEDATYADPIIDVGNVVDFAEWENINYSANAAQYFEWLLPSGGRATQGEMLHLYIHHLYGRLQSV